MNAHDDPPCDHWLPAFGCKPPMRAEWIIGRFTTSADPLTGAPLAQVVRRVHYAEGGGEEQPPFRGWFRAMGEGASGFFEVEGKLDDWRPDTGLCSRCTQPLPPP